MESPSNARCCMRFSGVRLPKTHVNARHNIDNNRTQLPQSYRSTVYRSSQQVLCGVLLDCKMCFHQQLLRWWSWSPHGPGGDWPDKLPADGAEGGLAEERGDELVVLDEVDLGLLDGSSSAVYSGDLFVLSGLLSLYWSGRGREDESSHDLGARRPGPLSNASDRLNANVLSSPRVKWLTWLLLVRTDKMNVWGKEPLPVRLEGRALLQEKRKGFKVHVRLICHTYVLHFSKQWGK